MLSLQNGLFCMRELTKAECAGDAHSGGSRSWPGATAGSRSGNGSGRGRSGCRQPDRLPELSRGSGDICGDDVGGVAVQAGAGPVVAHGGARVGVRCRFLHVAERDAGIECGGDERVAQGVRADLLGDPGAAGDPADDAGGAVPVQPLAVRGEEQRARGALADGQVEGAGGARGADLARLKISLSEWLALRR